MQNWETISRELERSGKARDLRTLADSEDGQKLSRMLDGKAVEQAAKSGDSEAYRYLPLSIAAVPQGEQMLDIMRQVGFKECAVRRLIFGTCSIYSGLG